jgi:hypothetical protein
MKTLLTAAAATFTASSAFAFDVCAADPASCSTSVPEISALEGTAALAAVAAIVLLAWERRRRAL